MIDTELEAMTAIAKRLPSSKSKAEWLIEYNKFADRQRERSESEFQARDKFRGTPEGRAIWVAMRKARGPDYTPPAPEPTLVRKNSTEGLPRELKDEIAEYKRAHPGVSDTEAWDAVLVMRHRREKALKGLSAA